MNEQEYRDMYAEYCMESGERMTDRGFMEFKAWRKRVEKLFEKDANQPLTISSAYGIVRYTEKTTETTRSVRIVTKTERWCGSGRGDPITSSSSEVI